MKKKSILAFIGGGICFISQMSKPPADPKSSASKFVFEEKQACYSMFVLGHRLSLIPQQTAEIVGTDPRLPGIPLFHVTLQFMRGVTFDQALSFHKQLLEIHHKYPGSSIQLGDNVCNLGPHGVISAILHPAEFDNEVRQFVRAHTSDERPIVFHCSVHDPSTVEGWLGKRIMAWAVETRHGANVFTHLHAKEKYPPPIKVEPHRESELLFA